MKVSVGEEGTKGRVMRLAGGFGSLDFLSFDLEFGFELVLGLELALLVFELEFKFVLEEEEFCLGVDVPELALEEEDPNGLDPKVLEEPKALDDPKGLDPKVEAG